MNGRMIPTIFKEGQGFPGIGPPPILWPFMFGFGTVMALVGMSLDVDVL